MAMLAEKKRKQKFALNPRGKQWSEDVNKFGHKMLEKMGWSSGKGLGANLDGMTEHVRVNYKNDACGVGFKEDDDQWTTHETHFSALLASLGSGNTATEISLPEPEKSLEKKSESSRARLHYHKLTRGKDLTARSEKDIANIFGRKSLEKKPAIEEQNEDSGNGNSSDKNFVQAGNMTDYFKSKLIKFGNISIAKNNRNNVDSEEETGANAGFGFSSGNVGNASNNFLNFVISNAKDRDEITIRVEVGNNPKRKREDVEDDIPVKKRKKDKKKQLAFDNLGSEINTAEEMCYDNQGLNTMDTPDNNAVNINKPAKKKRKQVTFASAVDEGNEIDESAKKKKKKKKDKHLEKGIDNPACEENSFEELQIENTKKEKKSKKKNKKLEIGIDNLACDEIAIENPEMKSSKKKRKYQKNGIDNLACEETSLNIQNEEIKKIKKKKKAVQTGIDNLACEGNAIIDEQMKKKKRQKDIDNPECKSNDKQINKTPKKKKLQIGIDNLACDAISPSNETDKKKSKSNIKKIPKTKIIKKTTLSVLNSRLEENINKDRKIKKDKKIKKNLEKKIGIDNLACVVNVAEEGVASMNKAIDNYQNELENEMNQKKVQKQSGNPPEQFEGQLQGSFEQPFRRSYEGPFQGSYERPFRRSFSGPFQGPYESPSQGPYQRPFQGPNERPNEMNSQGPYGRFSQGPNERLVQGPNEMNSQGPYGRFSQGSYERPFPGPYVRPFPGPYDRPFMGPYARPFPGPYERYFPGPYEIPYPGFYERPFQGPYGRPFQGPNERPFQGPNERPFQGPNERPFQGPNERPFQGPNERQGLLKTPSQGLLETPSQGPNERFFQGPNGRPSQGLLKTPSQGLLETPSQGLLETPSQGLLETPFQGPYERPFQRPFENPFRHPFHQRSQGFASRFSSFKKPEDKKSIRNLIQAGQLHLKFVGSNIEKLPGYGADILKSREVDVQKKEK